MSVTTFTNILTHGRQAPTPRNRGTGSIWCMVTAIKIGRFVSAAALVLFVCVSVVSRLYYSQLAVNTTGGAHVLIILFYATVSTACVFVCVGWYFKNHCLKNFDSKIQMLIFTTIWGVFFLLYRLSKIHGTNSTQPNNFSKCTFADPRCFDIHRCGGEKKVKVYFYDQKKHCDRGKSVSISSDDMKYWPKIKSGINFEETKHPTEACLLVVPPSMVSCKANLKDLPYWGEYGKNHVLIEGGKDQYWRKNGSPFGHEVVKLLRSKHTEYVPSPLKKLFSRLFSKKLSFTTTATRHDITGCTEGILSPSAALCYKASMSSLYFRRYFDESLPLPAINPYLGPKQPNATKTILISFRGTYIKDMEYHSHIREAATALNKLGNANDIVLINVWNRETNKPVGFTPKLIKAKTAIPPSIVDSIDKPTFDVYRYVMENSLFVLAIRGYGLSSYRLYEALSYGAIPVILSDPLVLPFSEKIKWDEICVKVPESSLKDPNSLVQYLKSIAKDRNRTKFMRDNALKAFHKFLNVDGNSSIINTALESSVLFIQSAKVKFKHRISNHLRNAQRKE